MTTWHTVRQGWTDERIAMLTKLWQAGLSASQIAKQLTGVTRNAVVGKVHRLGLSSSGGFNRAAPYKPGRPVSKPDRAPRTLKAATAAPRAPRSLKPALKLAGRGTVFEEAETREPRVVIPFRDEAPGTATIHTLGARMCKFPIGDPREPDFTFCGSPAPEGRSYCDGHHRRAHQDSKPNQRASEPFQARVTARFA